MPDLGVGRVRGRRGEDGRMSGESKADALPALEAVFGRERLVPAGPGESSDFHDGNCQQGCPPSP
jgi:hypothetical protein